MTRDPFGPVPLRERLADLAISVLIAIVIGIIVGLAIGAL